VSTAAFSSLLPLGLSVLCCTATSRRDVVDSCLVAGRRAASLPHRGGGDS
jgi:hypothetical protein